MMNRKVIEMNTATATAPADAHGINLRAMHKLVDDGRFFSVVFKKRTNGKIRKMLARRGVHKGLHGGRMKYNPEEKNLLVVWDVKNHAWRAIPADNIIELHTSGQIFKF